MPSILGKSVTTWQGYLHQARQRIGVLDSMPGVDGNVVTGSGWSAEPIDITTYTEVNGNASTAYILGEQYRALQFLTGTCVDQFDVSWSNVRVLAVSYQIHRTSAANVCLVETMWRLLPQVQRPPGR